MIWPWPTSENISDIKEGAKLSKAYEERSQESFVSMEEPKSAIDFTQTGSHHTEVYCLILMTPLLMSSFLLPVPLLFLANSIDFVLSSSVNA